MRILKILRKWENVAVVDAKIRVPFIPISWKCPMWANFPQELISWRERERKVRRRLFTSSITLEIRHFQVVVVVQWRQRNVKNSVLHAPNFCFVIKPSIAFWKFSLPLPLPSPLSLPKFLNTSMFQEEQIRCKLRTRG